MHTIGYVSEIALMQQCALCAASCTGKLMHELLRWC